MLAVSFAVQAHPAREGMAASLGAAVAAQGGSVEVVLDEAGPAVYPNPWRCYRRCLELTPAWASHRVIVQDDVTLCRNFVAATKRALVARPDRPVALYVAGQPGSYAHLVRRAIDRGDAWAVLPPDRWFPCVGAAWPARLLQPVLGFVDEQNWPVKFRSDDEILGRALRALGEYALATCPSLVQHEDCVESLIGTRAAYGGDQSRVACCFDADCDPALEINWDCGPS